MSDVSTVNIIRKKSNAPPVDIQINDDHRREIAYPPSSPKICVTKRTTLQPGTQTRVEVSTKQRELIMGEPVKRLYHNNLCLAGTGIADVEPNAPFKILVAIFGDSSSRPE